MAYLVGALVFCPLISALAFNAPAVTPCGGHNAKVAIPAPTKAPELELLRRQEVQLSLIEGPDEICGYQYGQSSGALEICGSSICGFATAMGEVGEIYCYGPTTSAPRPTWTSCLGGTSAFSCLGDSACSDNPGIIKCTIATESYCNVGTFVGLGVEAVWCDSTFYTGMIPISTTYVGQVGRELTPAMIASASKTLGPIILSSSLSTPVVSQSKSTPTPTPTPSPSPTPNPHSTPVGAIVGGVIGGLALIAAVIAGVFICLRIKRKDEQKANQVTPPAPVQASNAPTNPTYPSEKYPATAGATFMPPGTIHHNQQTKPEEHYQYQQPPQPQYAQQAQAPYPQTPNMGPAQTWQPPPQQYPQTGAYVDQHGNPQHPIQPYPPQDYKSQSPPPGRPQSLTSEALAPLPTGRESVSGTSSPGSPAPPYPSHFPSVPEMHAETQMSHHAYPLGDQPSEMPT